METPGRGVYVFQDCRSSSVYILRIALLRQGLIDNTACEFFRNLWKEMPFDWRAENFSVKGDRTLSGRWREVYLFGGGKMKEF